MTATTTKATKKATDKKAAPAKKPTARKAPAQKATPVAPAAPAELKTGLKTIPTDRIDRDENQPREVFDEEKLQELADSLKEVGQQQAITVRYVPATKRYAIISGERRWRAAQMAGLTEMHAMIVHGLEGGAETLETFSRSVAENLGRADMTPLEEARAFQKLINFNLTPEEVAKRVGKSWNYVDCRLQLLKLVPAVQEALLKGHLPVGLAWYAAQISPANQNAFIARWSRGQFNSPREAEMFCTRVRNEEAAAASQSVMFVLAEETPEPGQGNDSMFPSWRWTSTGARRSSPTAPSSSARSASSGRPARSSRSSPTWTRRAGAPPRRSARRHPRQPDAHRPPAPGRHEGQPEPRQGRHRGYRPRGRPPDRPRRRSHPDHRHRHRLTQAAPRGPGQAGAPTSQEGHSQNARPQQARPRGTEPAVERRRVVQPMELATTRYQSWRPELGYLPVGVTVGKPRFVRYSYVSVKALAPYELMQGPLKNVDNIEIERKVYFARLRRTNTRSSPRSRTSPARTRTPGLPDVLRGRQRRPRLPPPVVRRVGGSPLWVGDPRTPQPGLGGTGPPARPKPEAPPTLF
ncbi:ParB/RepB/Spo0J family partition protein [Streptomyces sp. INA 01156]